MSDTFNFTLESPLTGEQLNLITDAEFEHTDSITYITPKGKEVEFRKVKKGNGNTLIMAVLGIGIAQLVERFVFVMGIPISAPTAEQGW